MIAQLSMLSKPNMRRIIRSFEKPLGGSISIFGRKYGILKVSPALLRGRSKQSHSLEDQNDVDAYRLDDRVEQFRDR
jgi:hypothetical protein